MSWKKENKYANGGGSNALRRWQNDGGYYYYRLKCDNLRTWPSGSRWSESNRRDSWKTAVVAELTSVLGILDNGSRVPPRNELFQHLYSHPSLSWKWTWRILEALHDWGFTLWTFIVFYVGLLLCQTADDPTERGITRKADSEDYAIWSPSRTLRW